MIGNSVVNHDLRKRDITDEEKTRGTRQKKRRRERERETTDAGDLAHASLE